MKINFITTFLITYLIQIPYVYAAATDVNKCSWSWPINPETEKQEEKYCEIGLTVFYEFTTTEGKRYSLKACQTFLPEGLPPGYTGYIGEKCSDNSNQLPCYADSEIYETKKVYYVEPTFKMSTFNHDGYGCFINDEIQNICGKDPELPNGCPSYVQDNGTICYFTVNPTDTDFVIKEGCELEVSKVDSNALSLQFVRNGKIYSCATQLGEDAKFVQEFKHPIEIQDDGTIKNPGGQNSLDDCVLKQGSEDTPYKDDAGQYIFTSDTCSDLYCTDITADLCGAVS